MRILRVGIAMLCISSLVVSPFVFAEDELRTEILQRESSGTPTDERMKGDTSEDLLTVRENVGPAEEVHEVLVKYREEVIDLDKNVGRQQAESIRKDKGLKAVVQMNRANIAVLKIPERRTLSEVIEELESDPRVEYAEPNFKREILSIDTNDTDRNLLWGLDNTGQSVNGTAGTSDADIDAPETWALTEDVASTTILVGVIDSGVAYNHPDLAPVMWDGSSCVDEDSLPIPGGCIHGYSYDRYGPISNDPVPTDSSHGTHVAGTIAAAHNNSTGILGVAPNVNIVALKVDFYISAIVSAIDFAIANDVRVINASYGGTTFSQPEYEAIERFRDAGGVFIAAAGNDTTNNDVTPQYPAGYDLDNIISVAATDQDDDLASFSNYGVTTVDVGAPGTNIYSTIAQEEILFEDFEGVSFPEIPASFQATSTGNWGTLDAGLGWDNVLDTDLDNPYASDANTFVVTGPYDLSNVTGAYIDFWTRCDTEYSTTTFNDYMTVEMGNGGASYDMELMWDENLIDLLNDDPEISTGSATYHYNDHDIDPAYLEDEFYTKFRWETNSTDNAYSGCIIDDVQIVTFNDGSDEAYGYSQGTSMAAPHVTGLAAYLLSVNPALTYSEVKDVILNTGDPAADLVGVTVSERRINAYNAISSVLPPQITTVVGTSTGTSTAAVTWTTDEAATSRVYYSTTTPVATTTSVYSAATTTDHSMDLSGLAASSTYYFYVESVDENGNSATSTEYTFVTDIIPDVTAPMLTSVSATGTTFTTITIAWETDELATSTLYWSTISPVDSSNSTSSDSYLTDHSFTLTGLTASTTYYYYAESTDASDNTATSSEYSFTTLQDTIAPVITLIGSSTVNLWVGDAYSDAGATALDNYDGDMTGAIIVVDPVNTSATGTYEVTYNVSDASGNAALEVIRTVIVSEPDVAAPIISSIATSSIAATSALVTWTTDEAATSRVYYSTTTPMATSTSVYSGTATTSHSVLLSNLSASTTYYYYVESIDSSDNVASSSEGSFSTLPDVTPPVITLLGSTPVSVEEDDTYSDAGATALDNVDGNITADIVTVSTVDTSTVGSYTVTYNVTDSTGNAATTVVRTVNVTTSSGGGGGGGGGGGSSSGGSSSSSGGGDTNGDKKVDVLDFVVVMANWGKNTSKGDINSDGKVDILDFVKLMAQWTK